LGALLSTVEAFFNPDLLNEAIDPSSADLFGVDWAETVGAGGGGGGGLIGEGGGGGGGGGDAC